MDTPKSTGEFLGYTPIKNSWGLQNGDGLVVGDQGFYWPTRQRFPEGLPVYRTYNADFQRQLSAKDATKRVLPVKILFSQPETYVLYKDTMLLKGNPITQLKPVTVIGNEMQKRFFLTLVDEFEEIKAQCPK
jgi:hypothetical protein